MTFEAVYEQGDYISTYSIDITNIVFDYTEQLFGRGFQFSPRIGFNYGHFEMMLMYQAISHEIPNQVLFQAGFGIEGGKKKN